MRLRFVLFIDGHVFVYDCSAAKEDEDAEQLYVEVAVLTCNVGRPIIRSERSPAAEQNIAYYHHYHHYYTDILSTQLELYQ